mgnify:CR=1 FL=1
MESSPCSIDLEFEARKAVSEDRCAMMHITIRCKSSNCNSLGSVVCDLLLNSLFVAKHMRTQIAEWVVNACADDVT